MASLCVQLAVCSKRNHVAPEFDELSRLALVMGSVMSAERSAELRGKMAGNAFDKGTAPREHIPIRILCSHC